MADETQNADEGAGGEADGAAEIEAANAKIAELSAALEKSTKAATKAQKAAERAKAGAGAASGASAEADELREQLEEANAKAAALAAVQAELEPDAKWARTEKKKRDDATRAAFGKLPEATRERLGPDPTITEQRAFLAAFDQSSIGEPDAPAPIAAGAPVGSPPPADGGLVDPFSMDPDTRREWLRDPKQVRQWLSAKGVKDQSEQLDHFGRPVTR